MTKHLFALALAASFGMAHAADVKPGEAKPAADTAKATPAKTSDAQKTDAKSKAKPAADVKSNIPNP